MVPTNEQDQGSGQYTVGSLFAGVGGICLAFKRAGFRVEWANEIDHKACETYRANFPDHPLLEWDVTKLCAGDLWPVDVLVSGFPCQAFSVAGKREGFADPRGNMFFQTTRVIDALKPKAFLFENVVGLLGHDKGRTFETIKREMSDRGYSFMHFTLNACTHGNLPQNRDRVFMVGFRGEAGAEELASRFVVPDPVPLVRTVADCLSVGRQNDKYYYVADHDITRALDAYGAKAGQVYQWRRKYVRENKSGLCPALTANMGGGGHNVPIIRDDWGYRKLIPREVFRLQGFPETFVLPADLSDSALYHQAGNSVAVPVVVRVAQALRAVLEAADKAEDVEKVEAQEDGHVPYYRVPGDDMAAGPEWLDKALGGAEIRDGVLSGKTPRRKEEPARISSKETKAGNVHFSSKTDLWATPADFFNKLNEEFHFTLDVCALASNAKCSTFFSPEVDGLKQKWQGVCWMNPPYGRTIGKWMHKAYESSLSGATVVCLVPARTDTQWWHQYAVQGEIRFIQGRLKFGGCNNSAPFPSAVVIFRPPAAEPGKEPVGESQAKAGGESSTQSTGKGNPKGQATAPAIAPLPEGTPQYVDAEQVARVLCLKKKTVLSHFELDKLPGYKFGRGRKAPVRFILAEVQAWAAAWRKGPETGYDSNAESVARVPGRKVIK